MRVPRSSAAPGADVDDAVAHGSRLRPRRVRGAAGRTAAPSAGSGRRAAARVAAGSDGRLGGGGREHRGEAMSQRAQPRIEEPSGSSARLIARIAAISAAAAGEAQPARLGHADAVLGADRPAELGDEPQDRVVDRLVARVGAEHVDVHVAVAEVAEQHRPGAGRHAPDRRRAPRRGSRPSAGQRHADVELVRHAGRGDRLGVGLAQAPQALAAGAVGAGDRVGVARAASASSAGEVAAAGALDEQVHRAARGAIGAGRPQVVEHELRGRRRGRTRRPRATAPARAAARAASAAASSDAEPDSATTRSGQRAAPGPPAHAR